MTIVIAANHGIDAIRRETQEVMIAGNHNQLCFSKCNTTITITGNKNNLFICGSQIILIVQGNQNSITFKQSSSKIKISGDRNTIRTQKFPGWDHKFNIMSLGDHNLLEKGQDIYELDKQNNLNMHVEVQPEFHQIVSLDFQDSLQQEVEEPRFQQAHQSHGRADPQEVGEALRVYGLFNREERFVLNPPPQPRQQQKVQNNMPEEQINLLPSSNHAGKPFKCCICLQDVKKGDKVTFLFCLHGFHSECSSKWLEKSPTCPICKTDIKELLDKIRNNHSN